MWMSDNRLKCNGSNRSRDNKFASDGQNDRLSIIAIGDVDVQPAVSVRNLDAIFDQRLTFTDHIASCVKSANFRVRNIGKIR